MRVPALLASQISCRRSSMTITDNAIAYDSAGMGGGVSCYRGSSAFQANSAVNGGDGNVFGDGLRCAGGGLIRLQIRTSDAAGTSSTTIAIGSKGGVGPRRHQTLPVLVQGHLRQPAVRRRRERLQPVEWVRDYLATVMPGHKEARSHTSSTCKSTRENHPCKLGTDLLVVSSSKPLF